MSPAKLYESLVDSIFPGIIYADPIHRPRRADTEAKRQPRARRLAIARRMQRQAKRAILAGAALLLAASVHAQTLPNAPQPRRILTADHELMAYAITARVLDVVSTDQALGRGGREGILSPAIVDNSALMVGFEAAVIGVEWLGARELRKRGHPRLARMVFAIDGSMCLAQDVKNFEIQRQAVPVGVAFFR